MHGEGQHYKEPGTLAQEPISLVTVRDISRCVASSSSGTKGGGVTHRLKSVRHGCELEVRVLLLEEVVARRLLELSVRLGKRKQDNHNKAMDLRFCILR